MITVLIAGVAAAMPLSKAVDRALEADDALVGASIGLEVVDGAGEVRVAVDPDRRLIPASITKWVTAAAAAETLSLDFRFETGIAATGYTEGDVLHGDLVVIGGGDPSLGDPEVGIVAADVAALLRGLGVSAVDGDVVVDASRFDGPPHGPGWMWDDLAFPYSPPYAAANVAHNLARPGVGCAARGAPGSPVVDPPLCLGEVLRDGLAAAGVPVSGAAVVRSAPDAAAIGALRSAPLRDLLRTMLVESDNLYAECIARALDREGIAEAQVARERVDAVLAAAGVAPSQLAVVDGSGLSRYSIASADGMVRLSGWIASRPWGSELVDLLPVAGRDGTLAGRMVGTAAEGRVRAKTGSMTGVRNLVGYVDLASGDRARFAFLINGLAVPQARAIAVQDRVVAVIAASNGRRVPRREVAAALGAAGG